MLQKDQTKALLLRWSATAPRSGVFRHIPRARCTGSSRSSPRPGCPHLHVADVRYDAHDCWGP